MPRKENIHNMFNSIASDYDKLNHIMSPSQVLGLKVCATTPGKMYLK